ncbi:hypothetical protein KUV73_01005 [Mameliella alba]|nr:hypothetical protein [Mameliella alba]MBY6167892.1 hypothetical protein [Mameliella alba]MBY6172913.1 hypothetical protein [Mameliella alba]
MSQRFAKLATHLAERQWANTIFTIRANLMFERFTTVLHWAAGIIGFCFAWIVLVVGTESQIYRPGSDDILAVPVFTGVAVVGFAGLWIGTYIIRGKAMSLGETLGIVFGKIPPTAWFVASFMYAVGLANLFWPIIGAPVLWTDRFAQGLGAAALALCVGAAGRRFTRNPILGHFYGALIVLLFAQIIVFVVLLLQATPAS